MPEFPQVLENEVRELFQNFPDLEHVVDRNLFIRGARVAQERNNYRLPGLTDAESRALEAEGELGFLEQTKDLKVTILTTACAAITQ